MAKEIYSMQFLNDRVIIELNAIRLKLRTTAKNKSDYRPEILVY